MQSNTAHHCGEWRVRKTLGSCCAKDCEPE